MSPVGCLVPRGRRCRGLAGEGERLADTDWPARRSLLTLNHKEHLKTDIKKWGDRV